MEDAPDLIALHGRSDRTKLLQLARKLPDRHLARLDPLMARGFVAVLAGEAIGLRFPARALPPTQAHAQLILTGELELPVQEALRRTVGPGAVVYDVGANVGYFTLLAARFAGDGGRVLAFEPVPANAEIVREAAQRSGLSERVEVRAEAVALAPGREDLHVIADASWSHLASRGNPGGAVATISVPVTSLDAALAAGAPPPDVVKLDVEGSEGDVLRGAQHVLREVRPVVIVELHETHADALPLLRDAGYALEALDGAYAPDDPACRHVLARPRG